MTDQNIMSFVEELIRLVRYRAIRDCSARLSLNAKSSTAKLWKEVLAQTNLDSIRDVIISDCIDEAISCLLSAIDAGVIRLTFTGPDGHSVDLTNEGLGELAGWRLGEGGWREWSRERVNDDLTLTRTDGAEAAPRLPLSQNAIDKLRESGVNAPARIPWSTLPDQNIMCFAEALVRSVRDRAIQNCLLRLSPQATEPTAKRWKGVLAQKDLDSVRNLIIPDCVDELIFYLLVAIDDGDIRLTFTCPDGHSVDLTDAGLGELAGWYVGGEDGWREQFSRERVNNYLT